MGSPPAGAPNPTDHAAAGPAPADPGAAAAWLRLTAEVAPVGCFTWDPAAGTIAWGSEAARRLLGRPEGELEVGLDRLVAEAIHPDDAGPFRRELESGRAAGRLAWSGRCRDAGGRFRPVEWRGEALAGPGDRPGRLAGIVAAVGPGGPAAQEAYRRQAVDSVPALISYIDRDLRYVAVNETYRAWFGRDPQDLVGVAVADVLGQPTFDQLRPYMARALGGEPQRFEGELSYRPGERRAVELNYTPVEPDESGAIPGFVVLAFDVTEQKRLERRARAGEERWRGLFEGMAEGFFFAELIRDPATGRAVDFRYLEVNPAFETLTGFAVATTVGRTVRELVPDFEDEVVQIYARVVATGTPERFEVSLPSHRDEWFEATARHVGGAQFSVIFGRVTARKRAEAEARERERKQAALLTLGDRLRDLKTVGAITSAAMELLGTTLGVVRAGYGRVEDDPETLIIEDDWHRESVGSLVGRYRLEDYGRLGEQLRDRETLVVADVAAHPVTAAEAGRWHALDIRAVINIPIVEAGRLSALFFIQSDVPRAWTGEELAFVREVADRTWATVERARVVRELAASEERFRQIANVAPQVLWTAEPDGTIDYVSDQHYLNTGRQKADYSPADWAEVIHPDDLPGSVAAWARAVAEGSAYEVQQRIFDAKSGGHRWHLTRALPTRDAAGRVARWLGSNTDIDDQKRSEARVAQALDVAEAANRMKDDFLATLSHELRTPLNAIVGWARILRGGDVDAEDLAEGLDAIERNGQVQSRLVEDLLDVSRIVSGNLRLDVAPLDVAAVLDAAIAVVGPAAQAKQIRIVEATGAGGRPILGDPARLQQVFWNLITNAVKFTPRGGVVKVALDQVESHVEVRVVDSGIGIAAEFLPHVFDRFRQADGSTTRRHGGLGLGLAIVKHLVEMHGGSIRATSPGADRGSTFVVRLPIAPVLDRGPAAEPPAPPAPGDDESYGRPALAGLRVLIVDDEPDARLILRRVLLDCRAEVAVAGSVAEALEQVERFRPEVILSDIGMPGEDGYDLIRRVRQDHSGLDIPAVALTAFARSEDRTRALRAGFQVHIAKPVDPDELTATIASLAGRIDQPR